MSDEKFPYTITKVEEKTNEKLLSNFHGEKRTFLQVGPKKFFFQSRFEEMATQLYNFKLLPDDVWIKSYPRSGTTLICELVWLLKNNLDIETAKKKHIFDRTPFLERAIQYSHEFMEETLQRVKDDPETEAQVRNYKTNRIPELISQTSQRIIKTHLPFSLLPATLIDTCKTVCIFRNPKDTILSFYHLNRLNTFFGFKGDFVTFYDFFEKGLVPFTPYWEQINEAWQLRNHPNCLFLFYENVIKDLPGTVRRVAEFLGKTLTEANVQTLVEHLNIDNCRQNSSYNMGVQAFRAFLAPGEQEFVRSGGVGGWRRDGFDAKLNARADAWIAENVAKISDFQFPPH